MERNPYAPPESKVEGAGDGMEPEARPGLGGCLIALLIVMIVGNAVTTITYGLASLGQFDIPGMPGWVAPAYLIATLVNLTALAAIFNWQRWGVFVGLINPLLIFALNLYLGASPLFASFGLVGPGILLLLIRPLWKHFK